jgi:hypothetical protein
VKEAARDREARRAAPAVVRVPAAERAALAAMARPEQLAARGRAGAAVLRAVPVPVDAAVLRAAPVPVGAAVPPAAARADAAVLRAAPVPVDAAVPPAAARADAVVAPVRGRLRM